MIICIYSPLSRVATKFFTMVTCFSRSRRFHTNSKSKKRGRTLFQHQNYQVCRYNVFRIESHCKCFRRLRQLRKESSPGDSAVRAWFCFECLFRSKRFTAVPKQRLACPTRLARSIATHTSRKTISMASSVKYGFSFARSWRSLLDKMEPNRNSTRL